MKVTRRQIRRLIRERLELLNELVFSVAQIENYEGTHSPEGKKRLERYITSILDGIGPEGRYSAKIEIQQNATKNNQKGIMQEISVLEGPLSSEDVDKLFNALFKPYSTKGQKVLEQAGLLGEESHIDFLMYPTPNTRAKVGVGHMSQLEPWSMTINYR